MHPNTACLLTTEAMHVRFPFFTRNYWARLRCRGGGPAFLRVGNRILYREADVSAWMDSHIAANTAETKRRRVGA